MPIFSYNITLKVILSQSCRMKTFTWGLCCHRHQCHKRLCHTLQMLTIYWDAFSNVHDFFYSRKKISSWKSITIVLTPVCLLGWKPSYPSISLKLNTLLNITHKNPLQSMASVVFTVPDSIRERERICEQTTYYPHKTQSICLLFHLAHQKSRSSFAHLQSYNRLLLDHVLHEQPL